MQMQKIIPHLWYDDQAEEAANFYVSVFVEKIMAAFLKMKKINIAELKRAAEEK